MGARALSGARPLRRALRWLLLLAALHASGCGREVSPRPSILLVVIDTLRADAMSLYGAGQPTTPSIDAWASSAVVFERAYSQSSWTKSSVASLFSSLYPVHHQVWEETPANQLSASLQTLAECLQEAGYWTAAVSENPHVQPETGFDQGFEEFRGLDRFQDTGAWILEQCRELLAIAPPDRPRFLYIHILDPHGPYKPGKYRDEFLQGQTTDRPEVADGQIGRLLRRGELAELTHSDVTYLWSLYLAELRGSDDLVGAIDQEFRAACSGPPLVLLTSDHGEEFLEHGELKHGNQLYEESIHIPLVIGGPGIAAGRRVDVLAQHIDLAPTLLDLAGVPVPPLFQGISLRPWLEGAPPEERTLLFETRWRNLQRSAVRAGDFKLSRDADSGEERLFQLSKDPGERRDVRADHPDVVLALRQRLEQLLQPIPGLHVEGTHGATEAGLEEALRAIGYLEGGDER